MTLQRIYPAVEDAASSSDHRDLHCAHCGNVLTEGRKGARAAWLTPVCEPSLLYDVRCSGSAESGISAAARRRGELQRLLEIVGLNDLLQCGFDCRRTRRWQHVVKFLHTHVARLSGCKRADPRHCVRRLSD